MAFQRALIIIVKKNQMIPILETKLSFLSFDGFT